MVPNSAALLAERWQLTVQQPFATDPATSWVAPVTRADGSPAVLKIGVPHFEADHEIAGLRFWNGDAVVRVLEHDESLNALLLERCLPGDPLRMLPEPEQDIVIAGLLRRLWRTPPAGHLFRPLAAMLAHWALEAPGDDPLVREGLRVFRELPGSAPSEVLLATDLHAGNVLRAGREPWLVIDPKPFVGDPAYDGTQHLFNCEARLCSDPRALISRMAALLQVEAERLRLWTFARAAVAGMPIAPLLFACKL